MDMTINQPLSNVQLELLKTFSHKLSENELLELKKILVSFFAKRLIQQADSVWSKEGWKDEDIDTMLNTKMRKRK